MDAFSRRPLLAAVFLIFFFKSSATTLFRGVYPFAQYFAAHMGIPVSRLFVMLSFGELLGAIAPLVSPITERVGPQRVLVWSGIASAVAAALIGAGLASLGLFVTAWCLFSLIRTVFFGAGGAFIGTYVPPRFQTRATGFAEFSWGFASFAGLPFIGYIVTVAPAAWMMYTTAILMGITTLGLHTVFVWVRRHAPKLVVGDAVEAEGEAEAAAPMSPCGVDTPRASPALQEEEEQKGKEGSVCVSEVSVTTLSLPHAPPPPPPARSGLRIVFTDVGAVALLLGAFLAIICASITFTNYAFWIVDIHHLTTGGLGVASTAIGIAELVGEVLVIAVGDHLNPATCACICCVVAGTFSLATIAVKTSSLTANMSILACYFVAIEAEFVFLLAAGTRVARSAQTTVFLAVFSALQLGRFVAALVVDPVWVSGGIVMTSWIVAGLQVIALACALTLRHRIMPRHRGEDDGVPVSL